MKNLKHIVLLFFSLMVLASCSSSKPAMTENKTVITLKETVHDTVFKIEKDSSSYLALLECLNGKVVIKEVIQAEPGRTLKSPKVRLDSNQLKIDCEAKAQELLAHYKNTHQTSDRVVKVPFEVNKLSWWQQTQIILFRIYAILTLLFALWLYVKSKI